MKVAILIHNDSTRSGAILSEIKYLHEIAKLNPEYEYVIWTINESLKKKVLDKWDEYWFWASGVKCIWPEDFDIVEVESADAVITSPLHSNLFGGVPNRNQMLSYTVISYLSNNGTKVYIRLNDSEMIVRDYRLTLIDRFDRGTISKNTPEVVLEMARGVILRQEWNYTNIYWLANGSKSFYDWAAETLWDKQIPFYRPVAKRIYQERVVYASDDLYFQVREKARTISWNFAVDDPYEHKLCYIGFFDTINTKRAKVLTDLFLEDQYHIPLKIFGQGTEILEKLKSVDTIEIEEGHMPGDSLQFYNFLNTHMAYIFIGKGGKSAKYIGKTVYDCFIAKTPVLVYKKMDPEMKIYGKADYYFNNEKELADIFEKLKNPLTRRDWILDQRQQILNHLPFSRFKF
jgi:hypothetical protein